MPNDFETLMDDIKKNTPPPTPRSFVLPATEENFQGAPIPTLSALPFKKKGLPKKRLVFRFLLSVTALALLALVLVAFLLLRGIRLGESMQFENAARPSFVSQLKTLTGRFFSGEHTPLRGETTGRINILLLGRAGEHYPGKNLTDTIIVMSIDTTAKKVALLSLPRDLYVPIVGSDSYTKLNSLYQYGLSSGADAQPLEETIAFITGEPIHYFVTLDFDGFEKIVDTLGGISVEVTRDLYDTRYPGKNYSYETFQITKGWQTLDGATALKYVRERHDDPEGDFGRAKRQQQVIQALKNKAFSLGTFTNVVALNHLIDTLGESIKTDMTVEDMSSFLELIRTLDTQNVTATVVDAWKKESLLRVSHVQVGAVAAFILTPRVGNWNEIRDRSRTLFHRDEAIKRKQAILSEQPTVALYARTSDRDAAEKMAALLREELGFPQVTLLPLPPFHNPGSESIMTERTGDQKPFSLDELLKRFSLTRASSLPFPTPRNMEESDFSIVMGDDLVEVFSLKEGSEEPETLDDTSFSEPLPPQPKKKH